MIVANSGLVFMTNSHCSFSRAFNSSRLCSRLPAGLSSAEAMLEKRRMTAKKEMSGRKFNEALFFISLSFAEFLMANRIASYRYERKKKRFRGTLLSYQPVFGFYFDQEAPVRTEVIRRDEFASVSLLLFFSVRLLAANRFASPSDCLF